MKCCEYGPRSLVLKIPINQSQAKNVVDVKWLNKTNFAILEIFKDFSLKNFPLKSRLHCDKDRAELVGFIGQKIYFAFVKTH
jgi:hypothetical protein